MNLQLPYLDQGRLLRQLLACYSSCVSLLVYFIEIELDL